MTRINLFFTLLITLTLASCQKDNEPVIIYNIEPEFNIELFQELSASNEILIKLSTLEAYPDNYVIEADAQLVDNKIEVNIYRIAKPVEDSPNESVITKTVKLGSFNQGTHNLSLIIRNTIVNEGALSVNPTTIDLDFATKDAILNNHYEVNRLPTSSFWGVAYVESSHHAIYLAQFMNKIDIFADKLDNLKTGNYGYFSINELRELALPTPPSDTFETFVMTTNNYTAINDYVQSYKSLGIGFHATIYTVQGEVYQHVSFTPESDIIAPNLIATP